MAHFAELDKNNIVLRVIVVDNSVEHDGENWCHNLFGGRWKQTSYNNRIRKQYAGIGYTYDEKNDVFVAPQPFPSWTLDKNHDWQPPVPYPAGDKMYFWSESKKKWIEA